MTQRLPPLNPLRAFEATARNRSLTKAAKKSGTDEAAGSEATMEVDA